MKTPIFSILVFACPLVANVFTVKTSNGPIIGHLATNRSDVIEYLGIPYAQPPVGPLRFAAPKKYASNGTVYVASSFVHYPDQTSQKNRIFAKFIGSPDHVQSEDCLTLNVWSKATNKTSKPVLVFIHGGRWVTGETNTKFYNGQYLANAEDVVVVTLNYRTNIFGFPGAPGIEKNLGMLDQRLAVEWARDNIAAFGGDPRKIVLFGQSAGGAAVDFWSYAYIEDPILSGIISHSGNALSFVVNSEDFAESNWYTVAKDVGCGSSGDVMDCMKSVDFATIEAAAAKVPSIGPQARQQPPFQPTIDDKLVLTANEYATRSSTGKFAKIPYMAGDTDWEAGFYRVTAYARGSVLSDDEWAEFGLEDFTCPDAFKASNRVQNGVPMWVFRYMADWDNLRLYPNSSAYHGSDLEMVFGGSADVSGIPDTKEETEMQALMMKAWATFAANPTSGLTTELMWPQYDRKANSLIRLGYNNTPTAEFISPTVYDSGCAGLNLSYWNLG
ncbi:uncharacterized protein K452DRAFT_335591 [Aplosporella prunicola CBS 121167]|uniref:Carboxylic ester hydrolase n=1 Tax=Aplosporella prunicola CBS 121167 TaxID=1176127 RepID=A0A6A6BD73_9PEZI|nr:uncharacterized protein K452DRAFT_335591 [Aplosporella prunicola CBS 121167]KAF2140431.1 hypothetical protein K452DRAFT_335591 [Aplosporella prunicola CBS 121167]